MAPPDAPCLHAHPEISRLERGEIPIDDLTIVPCGPNCALPLAAQLWAAWRLMPLWRTRVDRELHGDFGPLLPNLVFAPMTELRDLRSSRQCFDAHGATEDSHSPESEELPDLLIDLLREGLYRSIFALGAAWGQTRRARGDAR